MMPEAGKITVPVELEFNPDLADLEDQVGRLTEQIRGLNLEMDEALKQAESLVEQNDDAR